jgi:hypothetical protein
MVVGSLITIQEYDILSMIYTIVSHVYLLCCVFGTQNNPSLTIYYIHKYNIMLSIIVAI